MKTTARIRRIKRIKRIQKRIAQIDKLLEPMHCTRPETTEYYKLLDRRDVWEEHLVRAELA